MQVLQKHLTIHNDICYNICNKVLKGVITYGILCTEGWTLWP